jgi:hypothetical protein
VTVYSVDSAGRNRASASGTSSFHHSYEGPRAQGVWPKLRASDGSQGSPHSAHACRCTPHPWPWTTQTVKQHHTALTSVPHCPCAQVLEGLDAKLAEVTTSVLTDGDMVEQVRAQTTAATCARVLHHSGVMACGACCNRTEEDF